VTSELYEPLIERDLDAFPAVAHGFLESHSPDELWLAIARFAVLAYAPSQHGKRAVMACLAAHDVRDELDDRWIEMVIACARYAAESRQPWSEPPILDPPEPSSGDVEELRTAMRDGDRMRAERWLSARLDDAETALRELAHCDAQLMLETAVGLLPLLGEKGRYALLRMPVWELIAAPSAREDDTPLDTLITRAVESGGSPDAVTAVFYRSAGFQPAAPPASSRLESYHLARDYAQTLIAHSYARRLSPEHAQKLLHAVHHNLEHGDSFADWSFA
jgi:hypothetical protein